MKKLNKKGFTLIELLVVIAIIGVLSTMAIINVRAAQEKARDTKRITAVNSIRTAMEMYIADNNGPFIPDDTPTWTELDAAIGQYIQGGLPSDPVSPVHEFCYCGLNQDYLIMAVSESTSGKTFEGDLDDEVTTFAEAVDCVCDTAGVGVAGMHCSDVVGTGKVAGTAAVNRSAFCVGTND